MKFLLDQNLSHILLAALLVEFPESTHVRDVGLASSSDREVWEFARDNGFTIMSKDNDFRQRSFVEGHPPKVVWIRLDNCTTLEIESLLNERLEEFKTFETDSDASFLVVTPR